jgi:hypothetical protein
VLEAPLLERAYQIARSGQVGNVDQLIASLAREGYRQLEAHFTYSSLRRDLNEICRATWAAAGNPPLADTRRGKAGVARTGRKSGAASRADFAAKPGRPVDDYN